MGRRHHHQIDAVLLAAPVGVDRERFSAEASARLHRSEDEFARRYWAGTSEEIVTWLQPVIAAGIDCVIFYIPGLAYDHAPMQQVAAEVIPVFAASR